jgi:hypothetical protein
MSRREERDGHKVMKGIRDKEEGGREQVLQMQKKLFSMCKEVTTG